MTGSGPVADSPPASTARVPSLLHRGWQATTLRLRLVGALLVLAAFGIGITAMVGNNLLRDYLLHQTDQRLLAASASLSDRGLSQAMVGRRGEQIRLPNDLVFLVVDADGTLIASSTVQSDLGGRRPPDISGITYARALELGGRPFDTPAGDGAAPWRMVAQPVVTPGGYGSIIIATSLGDVERTLGHLRAVELLTGAAVLLGLGLVGFALVRLTLRPLTDIEVIAEAIGAGDLSRRVPEAPPNTEVGRLSSALNAMLAQIEQAAAERARSEGEARASEERMRRFVADASHELRTPLTSIRGFAELHRQQGAHRDRVEADRMLERIESESRRMTDLVEDLLRLARLDGQRPVVHAPVDLLPIVADAAFDAHTLAPDRVVHVDVPDDSVDANTVVAGDDAQLREVLGNLVTNALVHTPAGTPVSITLRSEDRAEGAVAVVEVRDEGPGMSAEHAAHVFERFYRTDASRTRAAGGSGLGLSIVGAIVEAHHGRVELYTAPGEGCTFRVVLPRSKGGVSEQV